MLNNRYDLTHVMAAYPDDCQPNGPTTPVLPGGFSGSLLWRLQTDRGPLCLRRWPREHPSIARLQLIHATLRNVAHAGFSLIPLPINARDRTSVVSQDQYLWDLTPWLAGDSDSCHTKIAQPNHGALAECVTSPPRISAALEALAKFHHALSISPKNQSMIGPAVGLQKRHARLVSLQNGGLDRLAEAVAQNRDFWPELAVRSAELIQQFRQIASRVETNLSSALRLEVSNGMCIRDIHRQHVLFQGDCVTGIIDFGAMDVDHVTCDMARLLGSMAQDDPAAWQIGLSAYRQVRTLSDREIQLVKAYDESSVLLSGINWLQWVFVDGRQFDDSGGVVARFDQITARLRCLASRMGHQIV